MIKNSFCCNKRLLDQLFVNSMQNNRNFFQFRFLDAQGREQVRVDRDKATQRLIVVSDEQLQDKSKQRKAGAVI